jgi:hypothetical protein
MVLVVFISSTWAFRKSDVFGVDSTIRMCPQEVHCPNPQMTKYSRLCWYWYKHKSRGTATNGCYCTVRGCTVGVISLTGVESRFPRTTPRPLYTGKLQYKNYSCVGMLPLKNPLLVTTKSATSNAYNATKLVLHVSAYFQYVSHTTPCKYNHVATVVAGPNVPVTGAFVSQLHCHFQWHEGSVKVHGVIKAAH